MKYIACFISVLFTLCGNAQTKLLAALPANPAGGLYKYKVFSPSSVMIFTGSNNSSADIWTVNSNTGISNRLAERILFCQSAQFNSKGAFYIEYEEFGNDNGEHFIHFLQPDGTAFKSIAINQYATPEHRMPYGSVICNDQYYIVGRYNGGNRIWESNGTSGGTRIVFSTQNEISWLYEWQGTLFFSVKKGNGYDLYAYNGTANPAPFKTINDAIVDIAPIGSNTQGFYFSVYHNDVKKKSLWRSNLTDTGTKVFRKDENEVAIDFYQDSFVLIRQPYYNRYSLFRGALNNPDSVTEIPFTKTFNPRNARIERCYNNHYVLTNSLDYGVEVAIRKDSISLITDLTPGPLPSVNNSPENLYTDSLGVLYLMASRDAGYHRYLYRLEADSLQALFQVPGGNALSFSRYDQHFYLFYAKPDTILLYQHHINDTDPPPPLPDKSRKEEWHRQLFLYDNESIYSSAGQNLSYPSKVFTDAEENVITGFAFADYAQFSSMMSSDTSAMIQLRGGLVFTKHNKYGELQWMNSIGDKDQNYYFTIKFTVDAQGDVVVFGIFFNEGIFDADTVKAPRAVFFLAKLDGKTGKVRWKKTFNDAHFLNDNYADAIVCDADGNIYLALMYENFDFNIDGFSLHADRSPANAMVKLDTDGNVLWAKNILTPWLDMYGNTYGLVWNPINKQVVAVQCQGTYRTISTCKFSRWNYHVQQITADGNIARAYNFSGDDLGGIGAVTMTRIGYAYLAGFFRGTLETGAGNFTTQEKDACNITDYFNVLWNANTYDLHSAQTGNNHYFLPFDAVSDDNFIYVLGSEEYAKRVYQRLVLRKYDLFGRLLAKRTLNEYTDAFNFGFFYYLADSKDHLILNGTFTDTVAYPTYSQTGIPYVSVLKIKKSEGWQEVYDYPTLAQESGVQVAPNPTTGSLSVTFLEEGAYDRAEVFDVKGGLVLSATMDQGRYQTLDISNLAGGLYFVRFTGRAQHTVKIVKQDR